MILVFFGQQGAGKGTYAQFVQEKFGFVQISTGDIIREEIEKKSVLGIRIESIIKAGQLLDDNSTIQLLEIKLSKTDLSNGIILDGFPRTLNQAEKLDLLLKRIGEKISKVFFFNVLDETSLKRLSGRVQCGDCGKLYNTITDLRPKVVGVCDKCRGKLIQRSDDKPEAIKKRLSQFKELTFPIIEYYKKKDLLIEINSNPEAVKVFPVLESEILKLLKH